jgi:uncharacterized protein DUF4232
MHHRGNMARAALLAAAAAALLAGCDSSDAPAAASKGPNGVPEACTGKVLKAELVPGAASSGKKKSWNATLTVTNTGKADCGLEGVGEVSFYSDSDVPIQANQQSLKGDGPANGVVVIAPGKQAEMAFRYGTAPQGSTPANCPVPAKALVVVRVDAEPVEVSPPAEMAAMPPLCGKQIEASPWAATT